MADSAKRYRLKSVEVEAIFYSGKNGDEVSRWGGWMTVYAEGHGVLHVEGADGPFHLRGGQWLVRNFLNGDIGGLYGVTDVAFKATYEEASDD